MFFLVLGIVIFVGIHLLPSFVSLRQRLVTRLGEGPYKGAFSAIALTGLILIIVGMAMADFQPVWEPPAWGKTAALAIMPLSLILLVAANIPSNVKRYTRHPMLWGVFLWSVTHLLANGDLASLVLFGSLGAFSLSAMFSANIRGASKQETIFPIVKDAITTAGGLVAYGILLFLHP
jgi:uncharacterized membrane protein